MNKPFTYSPTDPVEMDSRNVHLGRKMCEKLMKDFLTKEDPRTALWALLLALPMTTRACGLKVFEVFEVLRQFDQARATHEGDNLGQTKGVLVTG